MREQRAGGGRGVLRLGREDDGVPRAGQAVPKGLPDLWAPIPQGTGQTIAREIMVVADHNAYHIGEFAIMRQVMETWGLRHGTGA